MEKVTIIREDNIVCVNGVAKSVDCSELPQNIHAVQWAYCPKRKKSAGHIEHVHDPIDGREPNKRIDSFDAFKSYVEAWKARPTIDEEKAAEREENRRKEAERIAEKEGVTTEDVLARQGA